MNNNTIKLSIIIPLYNAEKYIAKCLDSILESDLPRNTYEIIVVDDGSKDKGLEIVKYYANQYPFISYSTQENQGQSVARNNGLKKSLGEYVWFVDSDDMVEKKINDCLTLAIRNHLDILITEMNIKSLTDEIIRPTKPFNIKYNAILKGKEVIFSDVPIGSVCVMFIKRLFLVNNHFFFLPGIIPEDVELSFRLLCHAEKVMFLHHQTYLYIKHPNSTSQLTDLTKRTKYLFGDIAVIKTLNELAIELNKQDKLLSKKLLEKKQSTLIGLLLLLYKNKKNLKKSGTSQLVIERLRKEGLYPMELKDLPLHKAIIAYLLNHKFIINYNL